MSYILPNKSYIFTRQIPIFLYFENQNPLDAMPLLFKSLFALEKSLTESLKNLMSTKIFGQKQGTPESLLKLSRQCFHCVHSMGYARL